MGTMCCSNSATHLKIPPL